MCVYTTCAVLCLGLESAFGKLLGEDFAARSAESQYFDTGEGGKKASEQNQNGTSWTWAK